MAELRRPQWDLLNTLCEAQAATPGDFRLISTAQQSFIRHPGLKSPLTEFAVSDLGEVGSKGFTRIEAKNGSSTRFAITNEGWEYWKSHRETGLDRVEGEIRRLLTAEPPDPIYVPAFERWAPADALLWSDHGDDERWPTQVGHICREAMQDFADAFTQHHKQPSTLERTKTIPRIRGVLDTLASEMSDTYVRFYAALLNYWGTVNDLVQRLEHGGTKEGEPVSWRDARAVVTQTAVVMSELSVIEPRN